MKSIQIILAVSLLVSIASVDPGRAQDSKENADFKLALNLFNDRLYDLAAEQLKQFITTYPTTSQGIEARFYLGLTQLKLKQFDDARLTFQTFALTYQDNPKAPEAWWNVGECFAAVGNNREAALAFERVKSFHPKSEIAPTALVQASKYFSLCGEPDNARRVLRIVLQEYGSSRAVLAARTQLGQMYFDEGNIELAHNELKRVIEGDPSPDAKAQALLILGNIQATMGNRDQAQAQYREVITKYASTSAIQGAYIRLGALQAESGKFQEAIESYRKGIAVQTHVDSALTQEAMIATGDAYASVKDYTSAVTAYRRFLSSFPHSPHSGDVLWKVALVNSAAKNYQKSDEACRTLLKADVPPILRRRAQIRLARNAEEAQNPALAVQHYGAFLDQFPDDPSTPEIVFTIGTLYEKELHDPRKAIAYYELLQTRYARSPFAPEAYEGAGRSYEELKEYDRALQTYRDLVDKFPASPLCTNAMSRIDMIRTFEAKDKDASVEKLALLLGDVLGERNKTDLAFRLGEIYFHDLKKYEAAAQQFDNAVNSGMTGARFVDALYLRARSFEYLSWKDAGYRQRAIDAYRNFLQAYPSEARSEQAALSLFTLSAVNAQAARQAYSGTLSLYPGFARRDTMLLMIGRFHLESDRYDSARTTFRTILSAFPSSPSTEEAAYQIVRMFGASGPVDSIVAAGGLYLGRYPDGRYAAAVLKWVADAYIAKGDAQRAIPLYQRLVTDFSYNREVHSYRRSLAEAYLLAGNAENAITILTDLLDEESHNPLREDEGDPDLLLALGRAEHAAGHSPASKEYLFRYLARERTGAGAGQAYSLLGLIYRNEGAQDIASGYLRQAAAVSPASAASVEIADLLFDSGEYPEAIREYTKLVRIDSAGSNTEHYESRIIIAILRNNELTPADQAIAAFTKKYRNVDDEAAAFELERGNYFFRKANYNDARKSFERVVSRYSKSPSVPDAMYWIGKTQEAINKPQEAMKIYAEILDRYPRADIVQRVYLSLGNIHYNNEKWDEAIKNYRKIVDSPNANKELLPFAMSNLIETYESAGVYDAALDLTRRYLELYPNNEDSFDKKIKIGLLYQRLGYYDQSIVHLEGLLDQAGSDLEGELRYYIAEANYNKGAYQQAILDFLKVPYLVTKKGKIDWTANSLYMSGQSYEKLGRYDQALTMYQQIIDRPGIDGTFKAAARKEIDRVNLVLKKNSQ
jgi:TolA-binding protein